MTEKIVINLFTTTPVTEDRRYKLLEATNYIPRLKDANVTMSISENSQVSPTLYQSVYLCALDKQREVPNFIIIAEGDLIGVEYIDDYISRYGGELPARTPHNHSNDTVHLITIDAADTTMVEDLFIQARRRNMRLVVNAPEPGHATSQVLIYTDKVITSLQGRHICSTLLKSLGVTIPPQQRNHEQSKKTEKGFFNTFYEFKHTCTNIGNFLYIVNCVGDVANDAISEELSQYDIVPTKKSKLTLDNDKVVDVWKIAISNND